MSESDDYLLFVISALRDLTWQRFKKIFDALYFQSLPDSNCEDENVQHLRWATIRALDCLGHCDMTSREGIESVQAAPPVLARLPVSGLPQAVFCGARSPQTYILLKEACQRHQCQLQPSSQAQGGGAFIPQRLAVEAESDEVIRKVANELQIAYPPSPPAWCLLQFSGSLDTYLGSKGLNQAPDLNWLRQDFDPARLQFRFVATEPSKICLARYENPIKPMKLYLLWRDQVHQKVDGDWGRYALLREKQIQVLSYDPRQFLLAVPLGTPLPRLLARACALCSGYIPLFIRSSSIGFASPERIGFNVFRGIPPAFAKVIAAKLAQQLNIAKLDVLPME